MILVLLSWLTAVGARDYLPIRAQWDAIKAIVAQINQNNVSYMLVPQTVDTFAYVCPDTPVRTMVQCDPNGNIVMFSAFEKGFRGDLSKTNWTALRSLAFLNLAGNQISGTLPSSLSGLTALKYLYLHHNSLTGPLNSKLGPDKLNLTDCIVSAPPYETENNCFEEQLDGSTACGGSPTNISTSCPMRDYMVGKTDYTNAPRPTPNPTPASTPLPPQSSTTPFTTTTTATTTTTTTRATTIKTTFPLTTATLPDRTTETPITTESLVPETDKTPNVETTGWIVAFAVATIFGVIGISGCIFMGTWYVKKKNEQEAKKEKNSFQDFIDIEDVECSVPHQKRKESDESSISMGDVNPHYPGARPQNHIYDVVRTRPSDYSIVPPLRVNEYDTPNSELVS